MKLTFLILCCLSVSSYALGERVKLEPGECLCQTPDLFGTKQNSYGSKGPKDKYIRGFCQYQAEPLGDEMYQRLLKLARVLVKDWVANVGFSRENQEAIQAKQDFSISWWFDDPDSNEHMCNFLKMNDGKAKVWVTPIIILSVKLFSFEKGSNRALGLQTASFFGKQPINPYAGTPTTSTTVTPATSNAPGSSTTTTTTTFSPVGAPQWPSPGSTLSTLGSAPFGATPNLFGQGIFSMAAGIGNPLASYLNLGIIAQMDRQEAQQVKEVVYSCELGSPCNFNHQATSYFNGPTNTISDSLGLLVQTTVMLDPDDPTLVRLENLSLRYAVATGANSSPVDAIQPYNARDLVVRTNQLYVIGSESSRTDIRTGQLLAGGSQHAHTQSLILLSVTVLKPEDQKPNDIPNPKDLPSFTFEKDDRAFTAEELKALPDQDLSVRDIFSSLGLVCYNDILNPAIAEKICGFQFSRLDPKHVNTRVHVHIDGPVRYPQDRDVYWKMGDLYKGKGYYQIPRAQDSDNNSHSNFEVTIELDRKSVVNREEIKKESVKGIKIPFTYYAGSTDPISWNPNQIKPVK